jgi:flagellar basal-body rod protein FlgF
MQSSLYVALSAQLALQRRLETISNNVANASTAGFRAEEVKFDTVLSQTTLDPVAFASASEAYMSRKTGEFVRTDNVFDVAVEGDAWLAVDAPGGPVYTRDGRMRMTPTGELQSLTGYPILDAGSSPIQLDPNGGPPQIARDGMITQGGRQIGAIGLFTIDPNAKLTRFENSGVIPNVPAEAALDFTQVGVAQGYMERANVNAVMEMSRLIMVSRSFDAVSNAIKESEATLGEAIRTLGPTS